MGILMLRVIMVLGVLGVLGVSVVSVMYYRIRGIVVMNELIIILMVLSMRLSRCMVIVMLMIMMRVAMMPTECLHMRAHGLVFSLGIKLNKL